jgi:hypothetical protein
MTTLERLSFLCFLLQDLHFDRSKDYIKRALEASEIAKDLNLTKHTALIKDFLLMCNRGITVPNHFNRPFIDGGFIDPPFSPVTSLNNASNDFEIQCMKYLLNPYLYFNDFMINGIPKIPTPTIAMRM